MQNFSICENQFLRKLLLLRYIFAGKWLNRKCLEQKKLMKIDIKNEYEKKDNVCEKCIRCGTGELAFSDEEKKKNLKAAL